MLGLLDAFKAPPPRPGPTSQNAFVFQSKGPAVILFCMESQGQFYYIVFLKDPLSIFPTSKPEAPPGSVHPHGQEMGNFLCVFSYLRLYLKACLGV